MGYIDSVAYVQQEIDNILREVRAWAWAYVDDIICGARSLSDLLEKLRILLDIFLEYNISIKPTKSFLNYPDVGLLGQRVNSLGLTISEEKFRAIKHLTYPETLGALKYYLGLTGYLRNYIHFYAQLAAPLQALKTSLLRDTPVSRQQHRAYASKTRHGPPTPQEQASFLSIQEAPSQPSTLVHHDLDKILWIDLDTSKEFGFGAVVFHTSTGENLPQGRWPSSGLVKPILFLSRLPTAAEKNYWPTELKIARFIWVVKKVKHLIESSRAHVIIQTDHSAILNILQQSSITLTTSTMRMNLRLVRASQFLQQFRLDVRHKPGKEHIIPDALSRLASTNVGCSDASHSELDALFMYNATLIEIHPDLTSRILAGYEDDEYWARLRRQVQANEDLGEDKAVLPFITRGTYRSDSDPYMVSRPENSTNASSKATSPHPEGPAGPSTGLKDTPAKRDTTVVVENSTLPPPNKTKLLYQINRTTGNLRLCIPSTVAPDILQIAHGEGHPGFSCCYKIITRSWYIRGLTRLLREFIRHCLQCVQLQTRRHRPYGSLQLIESPPVPFFTPTLDFVLALPLTKQGYNAIMSVTCKFSK